MSNTQRTIWVYFLCMSAQDALLIWQKFKEKYGQIPAEQKFPDFWEIVPLIELGASRIGPEQGEYAPGVIIFAPYFALDPDLRLVPIFQEVGVENVSVQIGGPPEWVRQR